MFLTLAGVAACLGCVAVVVAAIWHAPLIEDEPMTIEISDEDLAELHNIRLAYFRRREEAEADAARACEILGVDPQADTCCRDWCDEIAYQGAHVAPTISRIAQWRARV